MASNTPSSSTLNELLPPQTFPSFMRLPPEIRHQIYRMNIPSPGINFFNLHAFPNDRPGVCRSTNPPHLYLDLRRLSIEDDDEQVAQYDPSVFQARLALRQTCREAREICAIPKDKLIELTLTQPARGLFVQAGDGLLRGMTPLHEPLAQPEPIVRRKIQVHSDGMLVMSLENCSFNILCEEEPRYDDNDDSEGWSFDPEIELGACARLGIEIVLFCFSFLHKTKQIADVVPTTWNPEEHQKWMERSWRSRRELTHLLYYHMPEQSSGKSEDLKLPDPDDDFGTGFGLFCDRWGDCYANQVMLIRDDISDVASDDSMPDYDFSVSPLHHILFKLTPEKTDMRQRYIQSASLRSPKRLAR